jgi:predicted RNase H-like HicB family nuclease
MQFQIFIQNPAENRFTASVLGMPETWVVEGATKAEALDRAKVMLEERLAKGEFVTIDVPSRRDKSPHAALLDQSLSKDDPTFDDFLERMAEIRQRADRQETEME